MNIEIRPAEGGNTYTLAVLTKRFFPYVNFSSSEVKRRLDIGNIKYLVAKLDGATVGFADYEFIPSSPECAARCKLMGLAVLEEHRGKGIAKLLLESVLKEAKNAGCGNVFLLVAEDNAPAISLYNNFGFTSKGRSDKILNGKPILLMEKSLLTHLNPVG